jgi:hypothetical protein
MALAASCGKGGSSAPDDAGDTDADFDAAVPCDGTGISKGPWVVAANDSSAKIRWEACRPGTSGDVFFVPEAGDAAEQRAPSVETPAVVTTTYKSPFNPDAPPDYAGTWYSHEAALTGLPSATCFTYRLDADDTARGRFCTARLSGAPLRFLAMGDTNPTLGPTTTNLLAQVLPKNPDFVVHGGDIQYYASTLETWAAWFPLMAPMLRHGAFFPAIGNHEDEQQNPGELATYTLRFFGGAGSDGTDVYYRFENAGVWFFSVDTELPIYAGSDEERWLTASLADAASKPGFRFSVVYMHRPMATCGNVSDNQGDERYYDPIFAQNKVALVLQAHLHAYERFEMPNGVTYVTSGGGGAALMDPNANLSNPECAYRVASGAFFHAIVLDVTTGKLTGTVIDDQGTVRDTFQKTVP